ncbi:MAG: hypothetical protein ACXWQO_07210 [Bdellovibrionota bacterium]
MKNLNISVSYTILIGLAALLASCSSKPVARNTPVAAKEEKRIVEEKHAASELGAQEVAEIHFKRGSTHISKKEAKKLNAAIAKAQSTGKVDEIKIVGWADREFPSYNSGSLPKPDQKLADRRNEAIRQALEPQVKGVAVDKYNMAVYPNGVDRLFKTSDFRVKRSLEQAGIPNTDSGVKMPVMSGKALVMILLDKNAKPAQPATN